MKIVLDADRHIQSSEYIKQLVHYHHAKGIRAIEYGIMGHALFWAFRKTLGPIFTDSLNTTLVQQYSALLSGVVPAAVELHMSK